MEPSCIEPLPTLRPARRSLPCRRRNALLRQQLLILLDFEDSPRLGVPVVVKKVATGARFTELSMPRFEQLGGRLATGDRRLATSEVTSQ